VADKLNKILIQNLKKYNLTNKKIHQSNLYSCSKLVQFLQWIVA